MIRVLADTRGRLRRAEWSTLGVSIYTLVVAGIATVGFTAESTQLILLAALLALPASILAMPGYYAAYGMLALVPGANPSSGSGSGTCARDGSCHETVTGEPAAWFLATTDILGILALTTAAVLDAIAFRMLAARWRRRGGATIPDR